MLNLFSYRTSKELLIPAQDWQQIRASHQDQELAAALCAATDGLPMPDADISLERAVTAFKELKSTPLLDLLEPGPITLLRTGAHTVQPQFHTRLRPPGNAASNHFFHTIRLRTPKSSSPSAWQKWHDPGLRLAVCRRLLKLKKVDCISAATIRLALHMTGATPVQFKPGVAKAIYDLTQAKDVLDFSMGWGDRLAGFCASAGTRHYTGIDPNPDLHPLYQQQVQLYGAGKSFDLKLSAAEDVQLPPDRFDLVFTSPPYFGIERYAAGTGNEQAQSWARYPTADRWRDGFLRPVLEKAWASLAPGGVLAVNLADVSQGSEVHPLCEWLVGIVRSLPSSQYKFTLGMRLQGANYSDDRRQQVSGEPVWMWSKGDRDLPARLPGLRGAPGPVIPSTSCKARNPGSPAIRPDVVKQVLLDYDSLMGATSIGRKHGISKRSVYNILLRSGRKIRPRNDRKGEPTSVPVSIVAGLNRKTKMKNPRQKPRVFQNPTEG